MASDFINEEIVESSPTEVSVNSTWFPVEEKNASGVDYSISIFLRSECQAFPGSQRMPDQPKLFSKR